MSRSELVSVGKWEIESLTLSDLRAQFIMKEAKKAAEVKLPKAEYDLTTYPNMDRDYVGASIPVGFGKIRGASTVLIDRTINKFKFLGHSITSVDRFTDEDGNPYVPDSVNLTLGEFTYAAWDGSTALYVDYTADLDLAPDIIKELLTGTVRGASLSSTFLDTTSTGKGFGSTGARVWAIRGTNPRTGAEIPKYPIGLHVDEPTEIRKLISQITEQAFGFCYIDLLGVWQYRNWKPVQGEGLFQVTENHIIGELRPAFSTVEAATKVIAKYSHNLRADDWQRQVYSNEELRQLRGLSAHAILEKELLLTDREAAQNWAQRTVAMRGKIRKKYRFTATSELKQKEPGDYIRLTYSPQNIDTILLLTKVEQVPGQLEVSIEGIDNFGFGDRVGYWTADAPLTFPSSLGGGSFSSWADADTAAKKQWVRENWGIYLNDNGYADETDPEASYRINVWI